MTLGFAFIVVVPLLAWNVGAGFVDSVVAALSVFDMLLLALTSNGWIQGVPRGAESWFLVAQVCSESRLESGRLLAHSRHSRTLHLTVSSSIRITPLPASSRSARKRWILRSKLFALMNHDAAENHTPRSTSSSSSNAAILISSTEVEPKSISKAAAGMRLRF